MSPHLPQPLATWCPHSRLLQWGAWGGKKWLCNHLGSQEMPVREVGLNECQQALGSCGSKNHVVPQKLQVGTERLLEGHRPLPLFLLVGRMRWGRRWSKEGECFELNNSLTFYSLFCGRVGASVACSSFLSPPMSEMAEEDKSVSGNVAANIRAQRPTDYLLQNFFPQLGWPYHLKTLLCLSRHWYLGKWGYSLNTWL